MSTSLFYFDITLALTPFGQNSPVGAMPSGNFSERVASCTAFAHLDGIVLSPFLAFE